MESTHTVSVPEDCGACVKPSFMPLEELPLVMETIHAAERDLDGNGRVVVRYSGTEKLARVMIEAESEAAMRRHTDAIADAIQLAIGV